MGQKVLIKKKEKKILVIFPQWEIFSHCWWNKGKGFYSVA